MCNDGGRCSEKVDISYIHFVKVRNCLHGTSKGFHRHTRLVVDLDYCVVLETYG